MSWTEALGFVLALVMVVCSMRELHWSWPLAIASSVLYFFVFRDSLLYAEASLQIVFAVLALWGWLERAGRQAASLEAAQARREVAALERRIQQMETRRAEEDRAIREPDPVGRLRDEWSR